MANAQVSWPILVILILAQKIVTVLSLHPALFWLHLKKSSFSTKNGKSCMIDSTLEFLPVTDTEMHFDIDEF